MSIFNFLTLFGGLALFLYGMELMGAGLERASGGKLEKILENLTSNIFKAVLLGLGVTAVIQSSSATTVMVVGFVNSGIMPLSRAVGIIMGANIGTTVTAWILSLAGIESSNMFIQLLNPNSFSPILAVIGICLIMFSKNERHKDIGNIMIGFTILMFGMDTMSGAVEPLADVPAFTNILLMFSNPVLGVLAGAVLTAIIQSSSASVGILQALCMTGTVKYSTALPIIMGQNIGTCITAILSSIGANRNAKRAACIHLLFNLIGTVLFLSVFYTANLFLHFEFLDQSASPAGIAVIHTTFNVTVTLILLPFNKMLEMPSYALEQSKAASITMFQEAKDTLEQAASLVAEYNQDVMNKVRKSEDTVDGYEDQICKYLLAVSRKNLNERESQTLSVLLYSATDIETISDMACNIGLACRTLASKEGVFSDKAKRELQVEQRAADDMINATIQMFEDRRIQEVYAYFRVVNELAAEMQERHVERLRRNECTVDMGIVLTDIISSYERIADKCVKIAGYLAQMGDKELEIHDHDRLQERSEYQELYRSLKERYALPG